MSRRTLRFVERADGLGRVDPDTTIVVLDTWWAPDGATPANVIPLRPVTDRILPDIDLVNGSLERLDAWAAAADLPGRFMVDGQTWWFKVRMEVRWNLHELMIWQRVLAELAP